MVERSRLGEKKACMRGTGTDRRMDRMLREIWKAERGMLNLGFVSRARRFHL